MSCLSKLLFAISLLCNVTYGIMNTKCARSTKAGSHFTKCIKKKTSGSR
nr:MAG TPA: hypothetical protein [Bacteriophage sp.]